jgi:hypothetical protein
VKNNNAVSLGAGGSQLAVLKSSGAACDNLGAGYADCIHGGEILRLRLPNETSCSGAGGGITAKDSFPNRLTYGTKADDGNGAFQWVCVEDAGGAVYLVSTGLRAINHTDSADEDGDGVTTDTVLYEVGLRDLIDFTIPNWRAAKLTISGSVASNGDTDTGRWWSNPVRALPANTSGAKLTLNGSTSGAYGGPYSAGTVFALAANLTSDGYDLGEHSMGVVINNGQELRARGTNLSYLLTSSGKNNLWIEGSFYGEGGTSDMGGINISGSLHSRFGVVQVTSAKTYGVYLQNVDNSLISPIKVLSQPNSATGIEVDANSSYLTFEDVIASSNATGLLLSGSNHSVGDVLASSNSTYGIRLSGSNHSFGNVKAHSNTTGNIYLDTYSGALSMTSGSFDSGGWGIYGVNLSNLNWTVATVPLTANSNLTGGVYLSGTNMALPNDGNAATVDVRTNSNYNSAASVNPSGITILGSGFSVGDLEAKTNESINVNISDYSGSLSANSLSIAGKYSTTNVPCFQGSNLTNFTLNLVTLPLTVSSCQGDGLRLSGTNITLPNDNNPATIDIVASSNSNASGAATAYGINMTSGSNFSFGDVQAENNKSGNILIGGISGTAAFSSLDINSGSGISFIVSGATNLTVNVQNGGIDAGATQNGGVSISGNNVTIAHDNDSSTNDIRSYNNSNPSAAVSVSGIYLRPTGGGTISLGDVATYGNELHGVEVTSPANGHVKVSSLRSGNNAGSGLVVTASDVSISATAPSLVLHNNNGNGVTVTGNGVTIATPLTIMSAGTSGVAVTGNYNVFAPMTIANILGSAVTLTNSNYNLFNGLLMANVNNGVIESGTTTNNTLSQIVGYNVRGSSLLTLTGAGNKISGNVVISAGTACGASGATDASCNAAGSSDFTRTSGVNLSGSFVAKALSDSGNTGSVSALYQNVSDWYRFENFFRGWGRTGSTFPNSDHAQACRTNNVSCAIWDWSLRSADSQIRDKSGNGSTANGAFTSGSACPAEVHGDVRVQTVSFDTANASAYPGWSNGIELTGNGINGCESGESCVQRYLTNAIEYLAVSTGDLDGLCESGEACLYAPNFGAYQGHGSVLGTCVFSNGTLSNIQMYGWQSNGR